MTGYLGMDPRKYLAILRARRWLIAGIVGSVVVLVFLMSVTKPDRYQASADLLFGRSPAVDAIAAGSAATTATETKAATNLALASLDTVAARVREKRNWGATTSELKSAVSIAPQGDSDLVVVTAEWSTPALAAALANAFATEIATLRRDVARSDIERAIQGLKTTLAQQPTPTPTPDATGTPAPAEESAATRALRERISELELLKSLENGGVDVVEKATPPQGRSSPRPLRSAILAGFLALILALLVVALLARFDERVSDEDELAALMGAPVLARIPRVRSRRLLRTSTAHEHPTFLEAFEFLRLNLQLTEPERGSFVVAVTSPAAGDGKTTIVSWLARSLALAGGEVVAVDLDMRKPELHNYLNAFEQEANGAAPPEHHDDPGEQIAAVRPDGGRRVYTTEEVNAGLSELAQVGGNARRAARSLKAAGRDIPESTLRRWKVQHAPLYDQLWASRTAQTDGEGSAADLTRPTLHPHVRLLTAGDHPTLQIRRDRLHQLFAQLQVNADYVLVDTVPVSTVADASAVAAAAYGVVVVVDLDRTRRRDLLAAKKQLANARADVIGIVLNRAPVDLPAYVHEDLDDPFADQPSP